MAILTRRDQGDIVARVGERGDRFVMPDQLRHGVGRGLRCGERRLAPRLRDAELPARLRLDDGDMGQSEGVDDPTC
jgi:hypothetical protein